MKKLFKQFKTRSITPYIKPEDLTQWAIGKTIETSNSKEKLSSRVFASYFNDSPIEVLLTKELNKIVDKANEEVEKLNDGHDGYLIPVVLGKVSKTERMNLEEPKFRNDVKEVKLLMVHMNHLLKDTMKIVK